jgi:hypothetical protein
VRFETWCAAMSRDAILGRVQAALDRSARSGPDRPVPPAPTDWPTEPADPLALFQSRFVALGGLWHGSADGADVATGVAGLIPKPDGVAWVTRDPLVERLDLARRLTERGVTVVRSWREPGDPDRISVAVSGAVLAIADSGTFAVSADRHHGRLPGVLAPVHVVLITADQIVGTLGEALTRLAPLLATPTTSAVVLISGPSRTGDIEGRLVVGVHGPGAIHCIMVGGAA